MSFLSNMYEDFGQIPTGDGGFSITAQPAPTGQATTGPVNQTAPQSGGVSYTTINGYTVPIYSADMFSNWNKERYGTVDAGDGSNYGVVGHDAVWGLDPQRSRELYGAGSRYGDWTQWSLTDLNGGVGNGGGFGFALDPGGFDGMLKVGDKEGARFRYTLKDGQYVPEYLGNQYWNSNNDNTGDFTALAMVLGGVAAGALGGAAGTAAGGAGGAGATGGWAGMGLVDASAAGLPASSGGWWGAAEGLGSLGGGSSLGNLAGFDAPWPTGMTEGMGGGGAGLGNLGGFDAPWPSGMSPGTSPSSTSWLDILKKGSGALSSLTGNSGSSGGNSGLLDLLSAAYSANRNRDFADKLMEPYNYYRDQQNPFIDMLKKSYTEPDSFYGSNQYQGLKDVYQNQIDRTAAKQGRLSNPTDREVLLQKHAMSAMEDYRKGLATSVGATSPMQALQMYGTGAGYDSFSNTPFFGAAGYNGGTKSVTDILGSLGKLGSTATDVWDKISGWFK